MLQRLSPGQKAPVFSAHDVFGNAISLVDSLHKYTLLAFMRYAGCPWCNLAIHRVALEYKLLTKSRCEVIAFVQSTPENILKNIYQRHKEKPLFPIIADQTQTFYKLYGVRSSLSGSAKNITQIPHWIHAVRAQGFRQANIDGKLLMVPAMFLVSEGQQVIVGADYQANFFNNETFTRIYQKLVFGDVAELG